MVKIGLQKFNEMEKAHEEGKLIKICQYCGKPYKPKLRTYNKKTWKLKETPIAKVLKNGKIKIDKYVKEKKIVGNWMSSTCGDCLKIIGEDRAIYKRKMLEEQMKIHSQTSESGKVEE